jgi:hypothetical protein
MNTLNESGSPQVMRCSMATTTQRNTLAALETQIDDPMNKVYGVHPGHAKPRRHGVDAVFTARKEQAIREARPSSIAFAAPLPITSRTPFPARRRLAVIDRTKGSTESVGLGGAPGITLDTIAVRLSHTKIWASPIWICWTKERTSSRSSSDDCSFGSAPIPRLGQVRSFSGSPREQWLSW